jgi:hypothetical protein
METDDDLRVLLRSPALTLEPPTALSDVVRRKARRHRLRTRAAGLCTVLVLAAGGALVGPGLIDSVNGLRTERDRPAEIHRDPRFPAATTDVVTLRRINGAEILTWFEGADWCTATTRVTRQKTCLGAVDPQHRGFSWVVPARTASVTVDDQHLVAGILPPDATRVVVHMIDGREFQGDIVDGTQFPTRVWSTIVDDSTYRVEYYAAYDSTGAEIARKKA